MNPHTFKPEPISSETDPNFITRFQEALQTVRRQLGQDYPLIIGEKHLFSDTLVSSVNPCNPDSLIGRMAVADRGHVEQAVSAAWRSFAEWSAASMTKRAELVLELAELLSNQKLELAAWLTLEAAKNYSEGEREVAEAVNVCRFYALGAAKVVDTYSAHSVYHPKGVGTVIPGWSMPLALLIHWVIPPLLMGNTIIVKTSSYTPTITQQFMRLVKKAGFPDGVVNLLAGDDSVTDLLVEHSRIRFIRFTGSLEAGTRIYENAARLQLGQSWFKDVELELEAKNAVIMDESADLARGIPLAITSAYSFQGQKSAAMSRLIVVDNIYDEVLERFSEQVRALKVGPAEDNSDVAALISEEALEKVLGYLENGSIEARCVVGGERLKGEGYFVQPTVFADVPQSSTVACEEIFGPVVSLMRARDFESALQLANASHFAMRGGVMSTNPETINRAKELFKVGNLFINKAITYPAKFVPVGGLKLSGVGAKRGELDYLLQFVDDTYISE